MNTLSNFVASRQVFLIFSIIDFITLPLQNSLNLLSGHDNIHISIKLISKIDEMTIKARTGTMTDLEIDRAALLASTQDMDIDSSSTESSDGNDEDDIDDDEQGQAERTEICSESLLSPCLYFDTCLISIADLARALFPGRDIKVRMNHNGTYCQAVIEVKRTNDCVMTGEEKPTEDAAYRDLWDMVRSERRRKGIFTP